MSERCTIHEEMLNSMKTEQVRQGKLLESQEKILTSLNNSLVGYIDTEGEPHTGQFTKIKENQKSITRTQKLLSRIVTLLTTLVTGIILKLSIWP